MKSIGGNSSDGIAHKHPRCNSRGDFLVQLTGSGNLPLSNNSSIVYGYNTDIGHRLIISFDKDGNINWFKNSTTYLDSNDEFIYTQYWDSQANNSKLYKFDWDGNQIWSRDRFMIGYNSGGSTTQYLSASFVTENESIVYVESYSDGQMSIENQSSSSYDNYSFVDLEASAKIYVVAWNNSEHLDGQRESTRKTSEMLE